jgi:hypothetical protein
VEPDSIDQELAKNWVLTVSYIGNHGTHLFLSRDINYAPISSYVTDPTLTPQQNLQANIADENLRRLHAYDTTPGNCGIQLKTLGCKTHALAKPRRKPTLDGRTMTRRRYREPSLCERLQPDGIVCLWQVP